MRFFVFDHNIVIFIILYFMAKLSSDVVKFIIVVWSDH